MAEARSEGKDQRERLLQVLSAATFLIFFQAYMVAPFRDGFSLVDQPGGSQAPSRTRSQPSF
jgi:hypothetical protein